MLKYQNMKNLIISTILVTSMGVPVMASNFHFIDVKAPVTSIGTFIDAKAGSSAAGGTIGLVTYKSVPMGILGAVINAWEPISLGGTLGNGAFGPSVAMGTGVNLLPIAQASLYSLINGISKEGQLNGLKIALAPSAPSATIFVGPMEALTFKDISHCATHLTWFLGASISWQ